MSKIFFHVDVNSAFLSWSAIKHLQDGETVDLRTIPAVVGGDEAQRHGVVLAKSGPAKKYGIKTGESLFAARTKYPAIKVVPPDFDFYVKNSKAMIAILQDYTPRGASTASWGSPSTWAWPPTACWQKWRPTLKSPTRYTPSFQRKCPPRCGRCRWGICSAWGPVRRVG